MSYFTLKTLHLIAVIIWIGGAFFVTFCVLPTLTSIDESQQSIIFHGLEKRFVWIARTCAIVTLFTGVGMINITNLWSSLGKVWWWHPMIALWILFALILFILEPFVMRSFCHSSGKMNLRRMKIIHYLMIVFSFFAIALMILGQSGAFN